MERKTKIYLLFGGFFILTIVFGVTNYLLKMSELRRSTPVYEYKTISSKELMDMMKQNKELIIVDIRVSEYYNEGHIKDTVNLPYTSMKAMNKALKNDLSKDIVLYSEDGERSKKYCEILATLGYSKLKNLEHGIKGWIESGGEVVKEP
ncbi:MAG: rhodanese-like domain-containing protein [Nitrospirae bacterium]|nr:rhodanese-like domain-containing protein [Nitrospirota bacterium]